MLHHKGHRAIEMGERVRVRVKRILGPPAHCTVVGHVVGIEGDDYSIEIDHGEDFHLITCRVKKGGVISRVNKGDVISFTREEITLWEPQKASKTVGRKQAKKKPAAKPPAKKRPACKPWAKAPASAPRPTPNKQTGRWSDQEHQQFPPSHEIPATVDA